MKHHLFEIILRIKNRCQSKEEEICNQYDLSHAEFNGLLALDKHQSLTASEWANRMGLSPSRTSRVLNTMLKKDFCTTTTPLDNRRSILISLTQTGSQKQQNIREAMLACEEQILNGLSPGEQQQLTRALELLIKNF